MVYVDVPTPECFEDDYLNCEAAWQNIQKFKTIAEAVKFLRYHLGDAQVTAADDPYQLLGTALMRDVITPLPAEVPPAAQLLIHVEGGVVQDVTGLPDGWSYEIHDYDDDPDELPPTDRQQLAQEFLEDRYCGADGACFSDADSGL